MDRLKAVWQIVRDAGMEWMEHNATRLAAAVAFYSILSLAPLLILSISIAGMMFGEDAARGELDTQMRGLVGDSGADVMKETLANAQKPSHGIIATVIGSVMLLLGAAGVFGELRDALNVIWEVRPKKGGGIWQFVRSKFLSFGMVLTIGFLLLTSLVLSTALSYVGTYMTGLAPGVPVLMLIVAFLISLILITGLFAMLFRYLPDARIPWKHVWFGAVVTAVLFTLGKFGIGLYIAHASVGSTFGAAGSLVVLVVWVYYSALIVFFGAELTQAHARAAGDKVEPLANAERVPQDEPKDGKAA